MILIWITGLGSQQYGPNGPGKQPGGGQQQGGKQPGGMQPMGSMPQAGSMQQPGGMQQKDGMQQTGGMPPMGGTQQPGGMPQGGMQQPGGMQQKSRMQQQGGMEKPPPASEEKLPPGDSFADYMARRDAPGGKAAARSEPGSQQPGPNSQGSPNSRNPRHFDTIEDGRNQCQTRSCRHLQ